MLKNLQILLQVSFWTSTPQLSRTGSHQDLTATT